MRTIDQSLSTAVNELQDLKAYIEELSDSSAHEIQKGLIAFVRTTSLVKHALGAVYPGLPERIESRIQSIELVLKFIKCQSSEWKADDLEEIRLKVLQYIDQILNEPELRRSREVIRTQKAVSSNTSQISRPKFN